MFFLTIFSVSVEAEAQNLVDSTGSQREVVSGPNPLLNGVYFENISREDSFKDHIYLGSINLIGEFAPDPMSGLIGNTITARYNGVNLHEVTVQQSLGSAIVSLFSTEGVFQIDVMERVPLDDPILNLYGEIDFNSSIFDGISIDKSGKINLNTISYFLTRNNFRNNRILQYDSLSQINSLITIEASVLTERHVTRSGKVLFEQETYVIPYQQYSLSPQEFDGYSFIDTDAPNNSSGKITQPETQVTFYYEEIQEAGFEYDISPQSVYLSQDYQYLDPMSSVDEVKFNGKNLDPSEYEVSVESFIDTDTVGLKTAKMKITHKESGSSELFDLPISVLWGNTILLQGSNYRSLGSYTYFPEEKFIQIGWGTEKNNSVIHSEWGEDVYYSISFFRPTDELNLIEIMSPFWQLNGKGNQYAASIINDLPGRRIDLELGDIMKIYHAQSISHSRMTQLFINEQPSPLARMVETTYVELTDGGYVPLQINYVTPKKSKIPTTISNEELEQSIKTFLDMSSAPQVQVLGFVEYPDRTKIGTTTGIVRVKQMLSTGRSIIKDYEVPFTVELADGLFGISNVDNVHFGEVKQSSSQQLAPGKNQYGEFPKIQITDTSPLETWTLRVSQPNEFSDSLGNTLRGAYVKLDNLSVIGDSNLLVTDREIILGEEAKEIAWFFNHNNSNTKGMTEIQFGKNGSGMQLIVPNNTIQNSTEYFTEFHWELVSDPTLIKREEIK